MFPRKTLRFHLTSQKLIAGTALVVRNNSGSVQQTHRASVWRFDGGEGSLPSGWVRVPLDPEPGAPNEFLEEPFESLVGDVNDEGVVGGAKSWHQSSLWMVTPTAWSYDIGDDSVAIHRLGTTGPGGQQQFYESNYTPGVVCTVGSGTAPMLGGWIGTRCFASNAAPFTASLADPSLAVAELDDLIPGVPGTDPPIGRVSAIPPSNGSGPLQAVGYAHGGLCIGGQTGVCFPSTQFNSWPTRWDLGGSTWSLGVVATPLNDTDGFDFKIFDSTASLGGGYVRWFGSPESGECNDHAAVFYDPLNSSNLAYDIHSTLPFDEDRPRSRIAGVTDASLEGTLWLAVGSQYQFAESGTASNYNDARGVIWQSREVEGGVEWCGKRIDSLARNIPINLAVFACTDVLPGGATIGYGLLTGGIPATGWGSPGGKLILFTAAADYDGDLNVDGADLGVLLVAWGTSNPDVALDCSNDVIDGADLGQLLVAWAAGSDVARVPWDCADKEWGTGSQILAAELAAESMGFDGLEGMGSYLSVVSNSAAAETAEIAALITQAISGGGH